MSTGTTPDVCIKFRDRRGIPCSTKTCHGIESVAMATVFDYGSWAAECSITEVLCLRCVNFKCTDLSEGVISQRMLPVAIRGSIFLIFKGATLSHFASRIFAEPIKYRRSPDLTHVHSLMRFRGCCDRQKWDLKWRSIIIIKRYDSDTVLTHGSVQGGTLMKH